MANDHDRSRRMMSNVRPMRSACHAVLTVIDPGKWREPDAPYGLVAGAVGVAGAGCGVACAGCVVACVLGCVVGCVVAGSLATAAA